ncbi:MAG: PAS domain S-box protein [Bacteroidota bacterium]|nr:PAS domain S-box protein [Bacteroidota bacterium]
MGKYNKSENADFRQKAEQLLKASENRYRRLFESAKDGILILDAETGMITDVNPFLIEMLGYSEDQFLDKAIWEIGFLKDIVANLDKFSELQQKEYVRYDDLPLETADGRKISVEFISNCYFEDKKKVIQCNIRETTVRKRSELALQKSESHLRTLVKTIPDLIWLKDTNGIYLSCNPMFERFFGAREADIVGKTNYDFVDRELADFFRGNDKKAVDAGKPTINEEWVTFADDEHRAFLETIKAPIYDSDGTVLGILGIGRDITERKLAGQVLQASEKRFRAIFDQAPIAIALIDLQGFPIISNLRLTKMIGYSSDELAKMKFTEFTYTEDVDKDLNQFADLIAGKISGYSMEKRYIHKDGTLIWANLFVTTLNDNNGLPQEIIGMVEDITERKKAEDAMLESEIKYRAFFENSMDAILLTSPDGQILSANQASCDMFGYSEDELIRLGKSAVVDGSDSRFSILLNERNSKGKARGEVTFLRKDRTQFSAEISMAIFKNHLGLRQSSIIIRDITEPKKIQNELKLQANLLNNVGQAVIATDLHGNIIYWNNAAEKIYGWSSAEAIGQNIISLTPTQSTREQALEIMKELSCGNSWTGEFLVKRKDGSSFTSMVTDAPFFNSKEELAGIIGISNDITQRKLEENELIIAKEKAQESDRLKSAFLAFMSHEVRTPLNSIIGFSELLTDPDFEEDQKNEFIQHIISSGNNLLSIISDIMDISKMESGEITIRKKHLNAQKYISDVYEQFYFQAGTYKLELQLNLPDDDVETVFIADAERLMQIFNNLIGNAFKFTPEGKIEIGYQHKGKMVEFFVKDTGIGIPPEYHDKIFDRFRQVEDEKNRKYGGNGLGLAITKKLVELMGGKIWVDSNEGKGSAFYFTMPVC